MLQIIPPRISEIKGIDDMFIDKDNKKCHESILKCFHMMQYIRECLKRGDSSETILDIMYECGY